MPTPLLPPLKADTNFQPLNSFGVWEQRNEIDLENIRGSLDVSLPDADNLNINSIPDMWARPLLFEMALYDSKHPLHKRILGEWRGLLAILALKEWYNFSLTIESIDISNNEGSIAEEFLDAVNNLKPNRSLHAGTTWDNLYLILFNNRPIGLASPTTLVCTSVDCLKHIPSTVTWNNGEVLSDPIKWLNPDARHNLAGWVRNLLDELRDLADQDIELTNRLIGLLDDFQQGLTGELVLVDVSFEENRPLGLEGNLFRGMNIPIRRPGGQRSNVQLVPSPSHNPERSIIVVDNAIAEQWDVEPQNVTVWGTDTLTTCQTSSGRPQLQLPEDVLLRRPEEFFTEKLYVIKQENAFCGALAPTGSDQLQVGGEPATPILPIKTELLEYLEVSDLNDRIAFASTANSIEVSLKLKLSGTGDEPRDFRITREYHPQAEEVVEIGTVPVLEIWPNFKREGWEVYYTYFATAAQDTFHAVPFLRDGESESRSSNDNNEGKITKTFNLPEAMLCEYEGAEAGVLLIKSPDPLPSPIDRRSWSVGVDFGTTSTTVYRRSQTGDPREIEFETHLLQITDSNQRNLLYDDFLPSASESTPFLSLFKDFQNEGQIEPILDGHIYFLEDYKELPSTIVTDLKWSPAAEARRRTQTFLKQLCLQCAAEAVHEGVTTIDWAFSFPIAFSKRDREDFEAMWNQVRDFCAEETGLQKGNDTRTESESIVIAKFFASTLQHRDATGAFRTGAVCIDIGGETSDISIWQGHTLHWQTSLRFAGRHIFLELLRAAPEFLIPLIQRRGIGKDIEMLRTAKSDEPSEFYARADALIVDQEKKDPNWLKDQLPNVGREPKVDRVVNFIAMGISGLLHYVGLVLRYLGETPSFEKDMPTVYVGGNGSKMLHWLARGDFRNEEDSFGKTLLKQVILDASGFNSNNFDIQISKFPKHEAARGLVVTRDEANLSWDEEQFGVLAGETFKTDDKTHPFTEVLTPELLGQGLHTESELEQINNFVDSFNKNAGEGELISEIQLDEQINAYLFEQLQNKLANFKGHEEGHEASELHIEPLFILALKLLLKKKIEQWGNSDEE